MDTSHQQAPRNTDAAEDQGPSGLDRPARERGGGDRPTKRALVLAGGVALGAYEAGAYEALEAEGVPPDWIVGASIGAVNAAILAGNPPGRRVEQLRRFWKSVARDPTPVTSFLLGPPPDAGPWRKVYNEASALRTMLSGNAGLFRPKPPPGALLGATPGLYDLQPLRERLPELLDFERLNGGEVRLSITATDVATGERVVFDTARGARIGPEHVAASSALMPLMAPVEVEGRLLSDGGLAANTPLDVVLDEPMAGDLLCFVVELFSLEGGPPSSLADALSRAVDLSFGNQTRRILEGRRREHRLRALVGRLSARLPPHLRDDPEVASILADAGAGARAATVLCITRRPPPDEAHPGGAFDFSPATLEDRWAAGARGVREALRRLGESPGGMNPAPGLVVHEVRT